MRQAIAILLLGIFICLTGGQAKKIPVGEKWLGILGDSGTTGATQGGLKATYGALLKNVVTIVKPRTRKLEDYPDPHFFNITQPIRKLRRVHWSTRERNEARQKSKLDYLLFLLTPIATKKIDVEEYTWAYMVGNYLGLEPDHIVIGGEDGAHVSRIAAHVERLRDVSDTLPQLIIGHFSANDYCNENAFNKDLHELYTHYYTTIRENFAKIIRDSKPNPEGTKIIFLEPFNITEILTNQELLSQKVQFEDAPGGYTTCKDFHDGSAATTPKSKYLLEQISRMCASVFKMSTKDTAKIIKLNQIQNVFINAFESAVFEAQANSPPGYTWIFGKDFAKQFKPVQGDLSVDCFHPSIQLHTKMAKLIIKRFFS